MGCLGCRWVGAAGSAAVWPERRHCCGGAGKVTRGRLCGIIIEGLEEAAGMDADDFLAKAALTASSGPLQCRLCFSFFINLV